MNKIRSCLVKALLAGLILLNLAAAGYAEVVDRIVAVVNDEIITMSELQNVAKSIEAGAGVKPSAKDEKALQKQMLEVLIDRKLAKEEAKRRGISLSDKEINATLEQFRKRNNLTDDEALNKALSQAGLTLRELKQQISDQLIQQRLLQVAVGAKIAVSDAEIRRVYEERFKESGSRVHLVGVKMPFPPNATQAQKEEVKKKAETLLQQVKQGASLKEAAKQLSLETIDLGFVAQNDIDPRLGEFLAKLKPKEVAPVQTPEGFQLIQLMERRTGDARPFNEAAPEIRRLLMQQEMEKQFSEWVKTLREKAHIKTML